MKKVIDELIKYEVKDIRANEPLSRHTTWKVGGPADIMIYPRSKEELKRAMLIVYHYKLPWKVIGRGSNLLVRDGGIRGVVFKLDEGFNDIRVNGLNVVAGGGHSMILLVSLMAKYGLSGLEFAAGIPGNVGGAVYMNAGAHGSDIAKVLLVAKVLLETGEWVNLHNDDLEFNYRTSILQKKLRGIVTEATFSLVKGEKEQITSILAHLKDVRRQTQPLQFPCAGSVFRNPPGDFAGRLIEAAGLKGYSIGNAEVSNLHANFIINKGEASAQHILELIQYIIKTVEEKYHIALESEIQVIGEEK